MKKERKGEIMPKADIKSMTPEELRDALCDLGQPGYRAGQVFTWLHSGASGFGEMTNLPKTLRETLEDKFYIANVEIVRKFESRLDETKKYLYRLHDGECVESVLMKYKHGYSVCISTQVGCRMGCSFCASGLDGLCRSLTASEMLSQVQMAGLDNGVRVSNIVLMGMGEPLDNYDNTVRFLDLVSHPAGLNIGLRHISLSTSGVVPGGGEKAGDSVDFSSRAQRRDPQPHHGGQPQMGRGGAAEGLPGLYRSLRPADLL